ncbi:hypothetical protein B0T10DRAFT_591958 [Thelonectria olida]|uniref:Uncharacterized protein n=1 Tax=Thelonectria olida TaxID=1576542 RepID=A0A9P8WC95_9HYPO|nr:hypothetical protein B0T10DRAFT_591958 [Thelonectria olida]
MKTPDLSQYHDPVDVHDRRVPASASRSTSWPKQTQTLLLFLGWALGIAGACGHHIYYAYLDGKRADNQQWIVRSGTAIAFAAKLLFSVSIGTAYSQSVWQRLRDKPFSLGAIDGLFTLKNDPLQFLNMEIVGRASICTVIAAVSWALVLVPILVPASISVVSATRAERTASFPAYTLNFSKSFQERQYRNGTPIVPLQLSELVGSGANYDGYSEATKEGAVLILNTMYGKRIIETESPCGANCSFTQTFNAPAYKCDDVDYANIGADNPFCGEDDGTPAKERCEAPFNIATGNPFQRTWYKALNSSGDLCERYRGADASFCPTYEAWQDGKLWVAHQHFLEQYRDTSMNQGYNTTPVPEEAWEFHMFMCQSYNATYTIERTYKNFVQKVAGHLTYLNPVNYSNTGQGLMPQNHAAFAIHQTLYSVLSGDMGTTGRVADWENNAQLANSALVEDTPFPLDSPSAFRPIGIAKPVRNLRQAIQDLHFNITVSLLSLAPQLLYTENGTVTADVFITENVWSYSPLVLLATYAAAAFFDALAVVIGVVAMVRNKGVYGLEFSRIVATTRVSGRLDSLVAAWGDGLEPMPKEVKEGKVMYGAVAGGRALGFGVEEEVVRLRRPYNP